MKFQALSKELMVFIRQKQNQKLSKDFLGTAITNILVMLLGLGSGIISTRLFGPDGRGLLAAIVVWGTLTNVIFLISLPEAFIYYTARQPSKIGKFMWFALVLSLVQGGGVIAVGYTVISFVLGIVQPNLIDPMRTYYFTAPFVMLNGYLFGIARGKNNFFAFNTLRLLPQIGFLGSLVYAIVANIPRAEDLIIYMTFFQIAIIIVGAIFMVRHYKLSPTMNLADLRELYKYGYRGYWASLSSSANARVDQFLMSAFLPLKQLGFYAVAVSYSTLLYYIGSTMGNLIIPNIAQDSIAVAKQKLRKIMFLNLAFASIGFFSFVAMAPYLIPFLYGNSFKASVAPAIILLLGGLILGANFVYSEGLRGMGYPQAVSKAEFYGLIVTVVGLSITLPILGIYGAALSSIISYLVVFIVLRLSIKNLP